MSKRHPHESGGSDREHKREGEREHDKGNAAHIEIEERRFRGGLRPTPELYSLAREQWNQLQGAVTRSPMGQGAKKRPGVSSAKPTGFDENNKGESE